MNIGDEVHNEMISMFTEGLGGDKIADMIHRSSRTPKV